MADSKNVAAGKPYLGGGAFYAPAGTAVPTDATTALEAAYKDLGYISDDGVTQTRDVSSDAKIAWGGQQVLTTISSDALSYKVTFWESNADVLKQAYGDDAVTVDAGGHITVAPTLGKPLPRVVLVFEILLGTDKVRRIVVPQAQVTDWDDTTYSDGDPVGYALTYTAYPDDAGHAIYQYDASIVTP
jgi:hypothetical protein